MHRSVCTIAVRFGSCLFAAIVFVAAGVALAQEAAAPISGIAAPNFAPGVLTTIAPDIDPEDTFSIHDVVELRAAAALAREPKTDSKSSTLYEMAGDVVFRHDVWSLELSFKPLRMVYVDVPQPTGKMQRKLIWYLVYRVRNTGAALGSVPQEDGSFQAASIKAQPQRFIPQFALASQDHDRQGNRVRKEYLDRLVPAAIPIIRRRELSGGEVLNSVEMAEQMLQAEQGRAQGGLWGVALWEDVDPEIDFFSVYVGGLTNANRWKDKPGELPSRGRKIFRKTLQLNFWRPGDALGENEREIRYGSAPGESEAYGTAEGVAYHWIYR
jgi:hypothetical protein